jgi:hypothetical protein
MTIRRPSSEEWKLSIFLLSTIEVYKRIPRRGAVKTALQGYAVYQLRLVHIGYRRIAESASPAGRSGLRTAMTLAPVASARPAISSTMP